MTAKGWGILAGAIALLAVVSGLLVATFDAGRKVERSEWLTKQAEDIVRARATYDDSLRKANTAAAAAIADARQARDFANQIQQEITHVQVPILASVRAASCAAVPRDRAAAPLSPQSRTVAMAPLTEVAQPRADKSVPAAPDASQGLDDGRSDRLTLSAVRLWNSALAGRELPAGACRADDPTSGACASASEASLEDAFSNHTENAALCRQDRSQLKRLTDYLRTRDQQPPIQVQP